MATLTGKRMGKQRSRWHREEIGAAMVWLITLVATAGAVGFGGTYVVENYGVTRNIALVSDTTYADKRFAYIVPIVATDSVFTRDTLGAIVDTFVRRRPTLDSIPNTAVGRAVYGAGHDSVIFLSYDTLALAVLDSAVVDSFYTAWSITEPPAYLAQVARHAGPHEPPGTREPAGMIDMFGNNANHPGDIDGPDEFNSIDYIAYDPQGMRGTEAGIAGGKLSTGNPTALGIGAPLPPTGSQSVLIGKWPAGFGTGQAPFDISYERNWTVNPPRKSMYWSMYMYIDDAFELHPNSTKAFWVSQNQNNNHVVMMARNGQSGFGILLQFNDGPPDGEVSNNVDYGGMWATDILALRGSWFLIEFLFVANSANTVHDGKYRVWIDGVEKVSHDTVYYFDSADSDKAFSLAKWNPTWGGGCDCDVQQDQYILIDDWYVSVSDSRVTP